MWNKIYIHLSCVYFNLEVKMLNVKILSLHIKGIKVVWHETFLSNEYLNIYHHIIMDIASATSSKYLGWFLCLISSSNQCWYMFFWLGGIQQIYMRTMVKRFSRGSEERCNLYFYGCCMYNVYYIYIYRTMKLVSWRILKNKTYDIIKS